MTGHKRASCSRPVSCHDLLEGSLACCTGVPVVDVGATATGDGHGGAHLLSPRANRRMAVVADWSAALAGRVDCVCVCGTTGYDEHCELRGALQSGPCA